MTAVPRPSLDEAARTWLSSPRHRRSPSALREALSSFVERRFHGAAMDLRTVHEIRQRLLADTRPLETLHDASTGPWDAQTLGSAAGHSAPPDQGRLLFQLVRSFAPRQSLELGTNIGISAAYLALGQRFAGGGKLTTIEASGVRCFEARRLHGELGIEGIDVIQGDFDDVLPSLLDRLGSVDFAFLDGNHQLEATLRYFEMLHPRMGSGKLMVLDDIRWSEGMLEAWDTLRSRPEVSFSVDLGRTGLLLLR